MDNERTPGVLGLNAELGRLPTVARLYYTGQGSRRYKRASVHNGPGEALTFVSLAEERVRQAVALERQRWATAAAKDVAMDFDADDSDKLPELPPMGHPLQKLGARLAELLDDDHWAECERLLLEGWAHDEIDRKTGRHWRENSELEVWFPLTAEELERLRIENAQLRSND